jgi:hypothetical protein
MHCFFMAFALPLQRIFLNLDRIFLTMFFGVQLIYSPLVQPSLLPAPKARMGIPEGEFSAVAAWSNPNIPPPVSQHKSTKLGLPLVSRNLKNPPRMPSSIFHLLASVFRPCVKKTYLTKTGSKRVTPCKHGGYFFKEKGHG